LEANREETRAFGTPCGMALCEAKMREIGSRDKYEMANPGWWRWGEETARCE